MLILSVVGALFAGVYGILHDQVTYSISREYFTNLKFTQFQYANFGFAPRVFVGEIGFLATWWVGFFAAWFMARITIPAFPRGLAFRYSFQGFMILFISAFAAGMIGLSIGMLHAPDYSSWETVGSLLGVSDLPQFVQVAYIHNAGYLGALVGLIAAILYIRHLKSGYSQSPRPTASSKPPTE
jgi:hypothetical protein